MDGYVVSISKRQHGVVHNFELNIFKLNQRSFLVDEDEGVRRRAATCIGWLGQADLAEVLLPLLNDESDSVRRSAAEAMGNLRNRQTLFALIEHLNDPVESVGKIVLAAIEKITGKKMSKSLPKGEAQLQRLIVRWSEWWKSEQAAEERCVAQK